MPSTPTLTAALDADNARVELTVSGASSTGATAHVQFSVDGGATWTDVRAATALPFDTGSSVVYDYEQPTGAVVAYRARVETSGGNSAWSALASTAVVFPGWWLKDPAAPGKNTRVSVDWADVEVQRPRAQGVFQPLGADRVIVVNGPRYGAVFTGLPLVCFGNAALAGVQALIDDGRTLLLQADTGVQWYVMPAASCGDWTLLATADYATNPQYRVQFKGNEVARP